MKIYSLTNEDLAEAIEVIARCDELTNHSLFGFEDDKKKNYPSRQILQEAASRLARIKNEKVEEKDDKPPVSQTTIVIPTPTEEPKPEKPKPDEEPTPTEREVLKKAVVMLAEAIKDRSSSSAFDTCNKVLEMMRKLEK